ncbi:MAG: TIGR04076 family protein [Actinobacteria bacterium]|nr:TIGR04076 family protein [Actinomycetota bacterium]
MEEEVQVGFRVVGTVKAVKGFCSAGHKVGDQFELSGYSSGGLCGFFYHDIFPYLIMLQFGGGFPPEWGNPDVLVLDCLDRTNTVTLEMKRISPGLEAEP